MSTVEDRPSPDRSSRPRTPFPRDVAIVGMACVMPGAPDVEAFWSNILDGVDSVTEVPRSRWLPEYHYDPDFESPAKTPSGREQKSVSKWGGFVPTVGLDALRWGIPPASLGSIDPAQLMALKVSAAALEDAGYADGGFDRDRASIFFATGSGGANDLSGGYLFGLLMRNLGVTVEHVIEELYEYFPKLTEDSLPGVLTSLISGRVANRLDFGGKNLTIDSACASVLVALDMACNELVVGSSDLVLLGGVDLHNGAQDYLSFTAAHALSRRGRCFAFDREADGMTLAEGAGALILKRLADAEHDGDRIYAVVRGVGGSSDGRHLGLTAPRQEGQVKSVRRAYDAAGMSPTEVGLVEAHGTGTVAGDRTELATTTQVFTEAGAKPGSVVIGAVKSNIGHIKCASAMAALIKSARAAYFGVQPGTLHITQPNDIWDPETSPFVFLDRSRPWLDEKRVVGVSSFGFGGTNFHAVIENHRPSPDPVVGRNQWPAELFAFRAATDADLQARLDALATKLHDELTGTVQADRFRLRDIAASVSASGDGPVRLALVAADLEDLVAKVAAAREGRPTDGVYRATGPIPEGDGPAVAFLLPGPESARPGMGADLLVAFPELRDAARQAPAVVSAMLPPQAFGDQVERTRQELASVATPAMAIANLTAARALVNLGVNPAGLAGPGNPTASSSPALPGAAPSSEPAAAAPATSSADPSDQVRELWDHGVRVFVEAGPGQSLTTLVGQVLAGREHLAVAVERPDEHAIVGLLHAVAQLVVAGVPVDLGALHAQRDSRREGWDAPPPRARWVVNGHCAWMASGEPVPNGPHPAYEAPTIHIGLGPAPGPGEAVPQPTGVTQPNGVQPLGSSAAPAAAAGGDAGNGAASGEVAVAMEYLRILQEMITTGSEIVRNRVAADGH